MGQTARDQCVGVAEYLEGEKGAEVRHEFVNGRVYAVVGVSRRHNIIAGNIFTALREGLRGGPCQVYIADVKAHIKTERDEYFFYPDLMVGCDAGDDHAYYLERPRLVVEVLSDSTERTDRADKFHAYRAIETLETYVLVAQDTERVEVYRRETAWDLELYGPGETAPIDTLGVALPVAAVYESVEVDSRGGD